MLNIIRPHSPSSAILSAVIFNALVIICLIPRAMRGVKYLAVPLVPFVGIKLIDLLLVVLHLA